MLTLICELRSKISIKLQLLTTVFANGHIMLNTPVLVRSLKLSSIELSQYLDGWPPGNTGCCWHLTFLEYFEKYQTCDVLIIFGNFWAIFMGAGAPAFSRWSKLFDMFPILEVKMRWRVLKGRARTQVPTNKNYTIEFPTFGEIAGVSHPEVQWNSLALEDPPWWSRNHS